MTDRHPLPDVVEVEYRQQIVDFLLTHHFNCDCVHRPWLQPFKSKFYYAEFHRDFPAEKSRIPIIKIADTNGDKSWNHEVSVKVADTNHLSMSRCLRQSLWQVRNKPVCVALMKFSPSQCTGKVGDKVGGLCRRHKSRKAATWFRHKSCRRLSWFVCDFVADFVAKSA